MNLTIILNCICCLVFSDNISKEKINHKSKSYELQKNHIEFQKQYDPINKNSSYCELAGPFPQFRFGWIIEDKENYKFYKYGFMTMLIYNGIEGSVNWVKGKSFYIGLNMICSKFFDTICIGPFGSRPRTVPGLSVGFQMGSNIINNYYWTLKPINVPIPSLIRSIVTLSKGNNSKNSKLISEADEFQMVYNTSFCIGYKF